MAIKFIRTLRNFYEYRNSPDKYLRTTLKKMAQHRYYYFLSDQELDENMEAARNFLERLESRKEQYDKNHERNGAYTCQ